MQRSMEDLEQNDLIDDENDEIINISYNSEMDN